MVRKLFSRFTSPDLRLDIDIEGERFKPGDEVLVKVSIIPQEVAVIREGATELRVLEQVWSSKPENTGWSSELEKTVQNRDVFLTETKISLDTPYRFTTSHKLSAQSPPDFSGSITRLRYDVRAHLDILGRRDLEIVKNISVVPSLTFNTKPEPGVVEYDKGIVKAALRFDSSIVTKGHVLTGSIDCQVFMPGRCRVIKVELVRLEQAGYREEEYVVENLTLRNTIDKDRRHYQSNFSMKFPANALPSLTAGHSSVKWVLRAVIEEVFSYNIVEAEIQVVHGNAS